MQMENVENSNISLNNFNAHLKDKGRQRDASFQQTGSRQPRRALGNITNRENRTFDEESTKVLDRNPSKAARVSNSGDRYFTERGHGNRRISSEKIKGIVWDEPNENMFGKGWTEVETERNIQLQEETLRSFGAFAALGGQPRYGRGIPETRNDVSCLLELPRGALQSSNLQFGPIIIVSLFWSSKFAEFDSA